MLQKKSSLRHLFAALFFVAVFINRAVLQTLTTSATAVVDGGNVFVNCTTTDFAQTIIIRQNGNNQGFCFASSPCSSPARGTYSISKSGSTTSLYINPFDCDQDIGSWDCLYGASISVPISLTCQAIVRSLDSTEKETKKEGGMTHILQGVSVSGLLGVIKYFLGKITKYLTRFYLIINVRVEKSEQLVFYKKDASEKWIPLRLLPEQVKDGDGGESYCVTVDGQGHFACEIEKSTQTKSGEKQEKRRIEFRNGIQFDKKLNSNTTIEFLNEKIVECNVTTTTNLDVSEKKRLFQNCKTKLIPSSSLDIRSSSSSEETKDVKINQGINMDENYHIQVKARHMVIPHKVKALFKFEDSNQITIEILFGYADTYLKKLMAVYSVIGCAITYVVGLIVALIVWLIWDIRDIQYCSKVCMIATTLSIPNAVCLVVVIVVMMIWKWREEHPLPCELPVITVPSCSYKVHYGQTSLLECKANSHPPLHSVTWRKKEDGEFIDLKDVNRYKYGTVSNPSLIIENVKRSDAGVYRCVAANSCGTTESKDIQVDVNKKKETLVKTYLGSTEHKIDMEDTATQQKFNNKICAIEDKETPM